jgi:hypothetical protein
LQTADNVGNVAITGAGTIDGQGAPWWALIEQEKAAGSTLSPRPALIDLANASPASITGITIKNAPSIPADGDPAQPVTSTTPYYHDITVTKVTATGAGAAGEIIGLPERNISNLNLSYINIASATGVVVRNAAAATVSTTITPSSGSAWILQSHATVN